jgi:peptidoglycan-N-acetylglucosamine deacetylase
MIPAASDILPVLATAAGGAAASLALGIYGALHPSSTMWGPVISRGNAAVPSVALTFDDGPLPGTTDRILDTLGESGVRAAFFIIGRRAREWPDLVRRMHDDGHLVSNHTFDHSHIGLSGLYRYWQTQLNQTDDIVKQIIGRRPAIFRPPMGWKHWHVINAAADAGHRMVAWSRAAHDGRATSSNNILRRLLTGAKGGDVMLLHDGNDPHLKPQDRAGTREAVKPLIHGLRQRGLSLSRLDELLAIPAYQSSPPPGGAAGG